MTEAQALEYIHSIPRFSRTPTLDRIRAIMNRLGDPQKELNFIHIAGTNGKGSTAAMTTSILQSAGYDVGLYTSPYLEHFRERMRLNGEMISPEALGRITERVKGEVDELISEGMERPNEFELVTAIGLCWFKEAGADIVVLEVGLGGRYDATNIIPPPLACAVTSISHDHTGVLGNSLREIAGEKAGIIKSGVPVVVSPRQLPEVLNVLRTEGEMAGGSLVEGNIEEIIVLSRSESGMDFRWRDLELHLPLLGEYQRENVCTVLNLIDCLRSQRVSISDEAVQRGLANVCWPGRLELVKDNILLDAGHNPGGIDALCWELDTIFAGRKVYAVMGMLADKEHAYCIGQVAKRAEAYFAVASPSPRAMLPEDIAQEAKDCPNVSVWTSISAALEGALAAMPRDGLLVCCGSIPLVGEARQYLRGRQETA